MILGVLSDTHGNHALMAKVAEHLVKHMKATHLIHLGDDWEDKTTLEYQGYSVSGVPGLWCSEYMERHIPKIRQDVFCGLCIAYAHDPQLLCDPDSNVELLLAGHTHTWCIEMRHGIPFMNPGHLKSLKDRGREATYGVVTINEKEFLIQIMGLDGQERISAKFPKRPCVKESTHGPGGRSR